MKINKKTKLHRQENYNFIKCYFIMKKLLLCVLAGAIGFAGAKFYEHSQKKAIEVLLLQNVEALTNSPEEGVKIGTCYFDAWPNGDEREVLLKCADGTTMSTIYPCGSVSMLTPQSTGSCIRK